MRKWWVLLVAVGLMLVLAPPVLAQGGEGGQVVFGRNVTVAEDEVVRGDLVVFGGDVALEPGSRVEGDVLAVGGSVRIDGEVDGDAYALGGGVSLGSTARVTGDVFSSGRVAREPGATVLGQVVEGGRENARVQTEMDISPPVGVRTVVNQVVRAVLTFLGALGIAALGIVIVLLAPDPTRMVAEALVGSPALSLGVGLLTLLAAVLVLPVLVIICIGIPVAVVAVLALIVAGVFGWVAAGLALGGRLLAALRQPHSPVVEVAIGLLVLAVLVSIPCLGAVVALFVGAWGLGAVVLSRFGTTPYPQWPQGPSVAPPAPPAPPEGPAEPPAPEGQ
jgi:cytoskeletal protein CcmA (bactofilin family)